MCHGGIRIGFLNRGCAGSRCLYGCPESQGPRRGGTVRCSKQGRPTELASFRDPRPTGGPTGPGPKRDWYRRNARRPSPFLRRAPRLRLRRASAQYAKRSGGHNFLEQNKKRVRNLSPGDGSLQGVGGIFVECVDTVLMKHKTVGISRFLATVCFICVIQFALYYCF
mmetsp:Transcript_4289/g.8322  ORF Transcript_4289/g.8322 Transcript_4289/m.8322 type:complete len:167 (+) Transcript_4289:1203-1703(+)